MPSADGERFDPETLALLRRVLEEAWQAFAPEQRERTLKSEVALRILNLANRGVCDPAKLRLAAATDVTGDVRKVAFRTGEGKVKRRLDQSQLSSESSIHRNQLER